MVAVKLDSGSTTSGALFLSRELLMIDFQQQQEVSYAKEYETDRAGQAVKLTFRVWTDLSSSHTVS